MTERDPHAGAYRPATPPPQTGWEQEARVYNRPAAGQWARIIVDQGVDGVEAAPVAHRSPPDTICDGWATADFTVRMASRRGDAHRHDGRPRQDTAMLTFHPASRSLLFAVLDGVSSAEHSHVGADVAGHALVGAMWEVLDAGAKPDWARIFRRATNALLDHPAFGLHSGESADDVERRLGTTAVTGIVAPGSAGPLARLARVGDSNAWWLHGREYRPIFSGKSSGSTTVSSAVAALPRVPEPVESAEVLLSRGSALLAGTDGIGDPLDDGTGLVGELLAEALEAPPPMLGFAHLVDFVRETFDDDRTLLAVWPGRTR